MNQDAEHLRLLSMFHYIVAGIVALFSCFPIIYVVMGVLMVSGGFSNQLGVNQPPPAFGWMFIVMGGMFILLGWIMACLVFMGGRFLARRKNYLYCLIVAGLSCLFVPIGTILGVFTIILLLRPSVKELFNRGVNAT